MAYLNENERKFELYGRMPPLYKNFKPPKPFGKLKYFDLPLNSNEFVSKEIIEKEFNAQQKEIRISFPKIPPKKPSTPTSSNSLSSKTKCNSDSNKENTDRLNIHENFQEINILHRMTTYANDVRKRNLSSGSRGSIRSENVKKIKGTLYKLNSPTKHTDYRNFKIIPRKSSFTSNSLNSSKLQGSEKKKCRKLIDFGIPSVHFTAKAWGYYRESAPDSIIGCGLYKKREVASITKIMTCLVALRVVKKYGLDMKSYIVEISEKASLVTGTTANLKAYDELSLYDLLFGILLPSGNDAAYACAEEIGSLLLSNDINPLINLEGLNEDVKAIKRFLFEMNEIGRELKLKNTNYNSPHGLCDPTNYSCAADVLKVTKEALSNDVFAKIVSEQKYHISICNNISGKRKLVWQNTNKLLEEGYFGVKTGITDNAGACLVSGISISDSEKVIAVVLGCKYPDYRFKECKSLLNWVSMKIRKNENN